MAIEWMGPLCGGILISCSLFTYVIINNSKYGIGHMLKVSIERKPSKNWNNQILFLIGLLVSPLAFTILFYPISSSTLQTNPILLICSGLFVGIGYKLCNGGLITQTVLLPFVTIKSFLFTILLFFFFGGLGQLFLTFARF